MRPMADPLHGQLVDDVTARIEAELAGSSQVIPPDRLAVLCAAGTGQVSWASEVWGRSVFLAYAEEGLSGWADLEPVTGNRDGRVTLIELVDYVVPRVNRWAVACRGVRQTPVLLGSRDDFSIAPRRKRALELRPALPEDRVYPSWLIEGWARRDRWQGEHALRVAPWALRGLEAALMDAERGWRGGVDPDRVRTELERAVASSTREFETARSSPHPIPRSLALALALGEKPDERVSQAMVKLLQDRADPGQGQKPEELAAARTKQAAEFQKATAGASEFALAWAVFHAAAMVVHPTPADLVFYDGLLRGRQSDPLYIETLLLRRLADRAGSAESGTEWLADPARLALEAARFGEPAYSRPRSFSLLRPWLDTAARERHLGEIALFSSGFAPAHEADARLRRATELYAEISTCQEIVEHSWDLRDEALAFLPSALPVLESNRHLDATWESAIRETIDLDRQLYGASPRAGAATEDAAIPDLLAAVRADPEPDGSPGGAARPVAPIDIGHGREGADRSGAIAAIGRTDCASNRCRAGDSVPGREGSRGALDGGEGPGPPAPGGHSGHRAGGCRSSGPRTGAWSG